MKFSIIWHVVLAAVLIVWGLLLLEWISFTNSDTILGIGAIAAGVLLLIDR